MWDVFGKTDLFMITTNPIIRKDGAVVMGRGIAKEAATRFPQLPYEFGRMVKFMTIQDVSRKTMWSSIGVIGQYDLQNIGFFMVKNHWKQPAELDIIRRSADELKNSPFTRQYKRIDLNFPGIGNGKLNREDVLPLMQELPDNVHIWEFK